VRGARLAETSKTLKQGGTISLFAAVPTVGIPTSPTVKEEEEENRKKNSPLNYLLNTFDALLKLMFICISFLGQKPRSVLFSLNNQYDTKCFGSVP
jgi:hypothetical protein